ncbi:MAG: CotY/CotZ family spore coat protein [Bacilli bacterium]|nr:CotY/CotZ family spore coat protein [Bacilli bacterium]
MYCDRTPSYNFKEKDCILDQIKKIDQIQKEALIEEACDNCDGGLMFKLFNTKPVILYLSEGEAFKAEIPGQRDYT